MKMSASSPFSYDLLISKIIFGVQLRTVDQLTKYEHSLLLENVKKVMR